MPFKKKISSDGDNEENNSKSFEITEELCFAVAEAVINRDDIQKAISQAARCTKVRALALQKEILQSPMYKKCFEEYKEILKGTVYEDDKDTIMLQYNNIIKKATQEKKYEVVVRVLDKIRQLQAIGDKEMEFKMTFSFEPTEKTNLNIISENLNSNTDNKQ